MDELNYKMNNISLYDSNYNIYFNDEEFFTKKIVFSSKRFTKIIIFSSDIKKDEKTTN